MKYLEFKNAVRRFAVISATELSAITENPQVLGIQLHAWQKKGLVIRLKRGLYILNENDRKIHPSRIFLANALYPHSYVSTEYALGYYDLIPEKVEDVTSITTSNTAEFRNAFGSFVYQHVKTTRFFGFTDREDENRLPVLLADPEKALLDFIYFNLQNFRDKDVFEMSYRFQNLDILNGSKLMDYAERYGKKGVIHVATSFLDFMAESE